MENTVVGVACWTTVFMWNDFKTFHIGFDEDEVFVWDDWTQDNTGEHGRHFVTLKTLQFYTSVSWGGRDHLLAWTVRKNSILGKTLEECSQSTNSKSSHDVFLANYLFKI